MSRKAWMLLCKLLELKKYAQKTCVCGQPGGHSIRVLNGGALLTVEVSDLCGWSFSNQFEIVSETTFSCDKVGREL